MSSVLYDNPGPRGRQLSRGVGVAIGVLVASLVGVGIFNFYRNGIFDERWLVLVDPPRGQDAAVVWTSMLVRGLGATLAAAVVAAPIALVLGTLLATLRRSTLRPVRWLAVTWIELFRGLPVVLMMLAIFLIFGVSSFLAVVAGLVLYNSAIIAEILRAGIAALPKGQREAALAVGMTPLQCLLLVELPQAVRLMLPSLISQLVVLLKDSSLGFIIGYVELLRTTQNNANFFGAPTLVPFFFVGAAIYIAINFALSRVAIWLERRGGTKKTPKAKKNTPPSATASMQGAGGVRPGP